MKEIWSKLALNVCTLPTSALLRFYAGQLVEHEGTLALMRGLLAEVVAVANAQGIPLEFDERWETITGLLHRAARAKSSMLQDVEKQQQTEIEVVNGAITAAGERLGIPTPYNNTMVWMVRSLEATF
jgi:2-dehydropantoate 2-reductase